MAAGGEEIIELTDTSPFDGDQLKRNNDWYFESMSPPWGMNPMNTAPLDTTNGNSKGEFLSVSTHVQGWLSSQHPAAEPVQRPQATNTTDGM